jgi:general secretion pathway protein D
MGFSNKMGPVHHFSRRAVKFVAGSTALVLFAVLLPGEARTQQLGQMRNQPGGPNGPGGPPGVPPGGRPLPNPPRVPTQQPVAPPRNLPPKAVAAKDEDKPGPDRVAMKNGKFKLDFDKVEITDLVQTISDITGKLFIVPDNIHGKITILGPKHGGPWVTADEAYAAFLAALDANNLTLYQMGKYQKLVEKRDARRRNVPTLLDDDQSYPADERYVTKLFRLKHIDPDTVNGLLTELIGPDGLTRPYQPDLLILTDQALNMHRLERIIDELDVPSLGDEIRVVQVNYAAASDLAEKITNIFGDKNKKPGGKGVTMAPHPVGVPTPPGVPQPPTPGPPGGGPESEESTVSVTRVIADDRTNKLIIIASRTSFDRIVELIHQLDIPITGEGQIHVYYLNNAVADQVSTVLTNLIQGANQGRRGAGAGGAAQGNVNPAANQSIFESQVKISPDKSTNSLVIVATGQDYTNIVKVIHQLDMPRRQVFVEAVIMEVDIDDELDMGGATHYVAQVPINGQQVAIPLAAEPFQIGKGLNSLGGVQSLAGLGGFLTGLQGPNNAALAQVLGVSFFPSFAVLLQALQTNSNVNVLSTPHILASDNEDAEIVVGQNVPFQSGYSFGGLGALGAAASAGASTSGLTGGLLGGLSTSSIPIGAIQRTNVELKLKIKPQINEGDFVRLTVDESNEEIASTDPVLGPTTAKRSTKTVIVAKDQETVVIGGLMQDRLIKSVNKTPLIGDIPVLGWLFRYNTTKKQKLSLLIFLTPYIIRSQEDFRIIFQRKLEERRQFVEEFYGDVAPYDVAVDYSRKSGPVGRMTLDIRNEQAKVENGGSGEGVGEKRVRPVAVQEFSTETTVSPVISAPPAGAQPAGAPATPGANPYLPSPPPATPPVDASPPPAAPSAAPAPSEPPPATAPAQPSGGELLPPPPSAPAPAPESH